MSDEKEWYADKGYVRGGFYDEMGGMLVGVRAQDIANRLNELAEMRERVKELEAMRDEKFPFDRDSVIARLEAELAALRKSESKWLRLAQGFERKNEELQAELEKERSRPDYSYEAQEQLAELKAISLNSVLSWQDKHIAAFKILNPELLQEKGE